MRKSIVLIVAFLLIAPQFLCGTARKGVKLQQGKSALVLDNCHTIYTNLLEMFVYNNGNFAYDNANIYGKTDGLYYPRGTRKTVVYDAGIWVGAKVNNLVRVAMAEYSSEFVPGPMANGTFTPDQPGFKIYKIRRGEDASTNPDYRDWPAAMGAPVDGDGNPLLTGDQMTWAVYNDADSARHTNNAGRTQPLGIEIQQSTFAYERSSPLGNTVFLKLKIINKGSNLLDSTYVSIWADPDIGDAGSDLVGCDTLLSLGYCYNDGWDNIYDSVPPAVGIDFFQGPMVPGSPTDSAKVSGQWRKGYRNLPMTSFNRYINSEDPQSPFETYAFMRGLWKQYGLMMPAVNPQTGDTSNFVYPGDPQAGSGWIDSQPNDRRLMISSGPFTMPPGDTQEVVVAIMVGQGSDGYGSIGALKQIDQQMQTVFNLDFDIPMPPPQPSVFARGWDGTIELIWGNEPVGDVQLSSEMNQDFQFEGFNLYQGESPQGPWHKFATFDEDNEVSYIYGDIYDPNAGGIQRVIVQHGSNSGLTFRMALTTSQLDHTPLVNGRHYYFAVTAYSYDHANVTEFRDQGGNLLGHLTQTLETPILSHEGIPVSSPGVMTDTATHVSGGSDGLVIVEYLIPEQITHHGYEVNFNADLTWNLLDRNTGLLRLSNQTHQSPDYDFEVVDGIMVRTIGLEPGIRGWNWLGGTRWLTGESGFGGDLSLMNGGLWNGPDFWDSSINPASDYVDVEIRFSKVIKQKAYDYLRGGTPNYGFIGYFECPFTVWDVSSYPARQLNALFVENYSGPTYDSTWFPGIDGIQSREYLLIMKSTYSDWPNPNYTDKHPNTDAGDMDILYVLTPKIRPGHDPDTEFQEGQKLTILAAKPNLPADRFQFQTGFVCGDVNVTYTVDIADAVYLVSYIFSEGPPPQSLESGDVDCDGRINLTDVVYLVNYIFGGGLAPCASCP